MKKSFIAIVLTMLLVVSLLVVPAHAEEAYSNCTHTAHDAECGYKAAVDCDVCHGANSSMLHAFDGYLQNNGHPG